MSTPDVNLNVDPTKAEPTVTVYAYDFREPIVLIDPDRGSGICVRLDRTDKPAAYLREFARVLTAAADHLETLEPEQSSIWHTDQVKREPVEA